jgi:zinc protease
MVWGVCRRVLRDYHDAEDAFQATFLVLARRASAVMPREKLGNWLYGVAHQTAMKARMMRAKRRMREGRMSDMPEPVVMPDDLRDAMAECIDRELSRLPEKYRIPVVLCDLEGRDHKEVANQLGWPVGTVSSRLSRARAMLARRLSQRGVSLSVGSPLALISKGLASASLPVSLTHSTVKAACLFAAGRAALTGLVSARAAALTEVMLKSMFKMKLAAVVAMVTGLTTLALLTLAIPSVADDPAPPRKITTVEGITEYRLDTGLRVLLFPEPSRPKVTVDLTVLVGSRHEGYGEAGMAHLLEHMLFKGTPDHPNIPGVLTERGARFGGTTQQDETNYFETLNATVDNLDFALGLEADRLVHSNVRAEDLATEFSVVRNEFEMGENRPSSVLNERMMAVAYEWHNYGKSIHGSRSDIERVPIENLRTFYRKYYQPDNAVLVVAGQFDPAQALELIRKHFGPLPRPTRKLGATYTEEPAQDGERSVSLRRVGDVQIFGAMYHVPAGHHPDLAALEVLADALVAAPSGRLYKALVGAKMAAGVSSYTEIFHDPGIFDVAADVRKDRSLAAVRDVVLKVVEGIKEDPLTEEEVERSKVHLLKNIEQESADPNRLAVELGRWTARGDWRLYFLRRDRLEKVTPEQISEVAARYFRASNRTTGVFLPTDEADRAPIPAAPEVAGLVDGYEGRAASGAGEAFDTDLEAIRRRVITPEPIGGVKLAFLPKKNRGETVSLSMTLRYGDAVSLKGLTVAARFLPQLMLRGTKSLGHQEIRDKLDRNRADLSLTGSTGSLVVRLGTRRKSLPAVLDLLRQILREPTLPADQLEILKTEDLADLESARTDPQALSSVKLQQILNPYPKDDVRYSPTIEEEIDQVKATTIDQVKTLSGDFLGADHGEVAVVGDFEPSEVLPLLAKALEGWHARKPFVRIEKPRKVVGGGRVVIEKLLAGLTVPMRVEDPAYPAALIGNFILGSGGVGGLSSRLIDRLRQKDGFSYGTGSEFGVDAEDENATLLVYAIFNPANLSKVEAGVREEFDRLLREGVTPDELDRARKGYLEELRVGRTSDASLSSTLANNLHLGRTLAFDADLERKIRALTPDAVNAAVRKYFDPKALTSVVAGDFKKAEPEKEGDAPK